MSEHHEYHVMYRPDSYGLIMVGLEGSVADWAGSEFLAGPEHLAFALEALDGVRADQLYLEVQREGRQPVRIVLGPGLGSHTELTIGLSTDWGMRAVHDFAPQSQDDVADWVSISDAGTTQISRLRWLITLDSAARRLYYFLWTGEFDPSRRWERENEALERPLNSPMFTGINPYG
jgi:hypothetical protein